MKKPKKLLHKRIVISLPHPSLPPPFLPPFIYNVSWRLRPATLRKGQAPEHHRSYNTLSSSLYQIVITTILNDGKHYSTNSFSFIPQQFQPH